MKKLFSVLAAAGLLVLGASSCVFDWASGGCETREVCVRCGEVDGTEECCDTTAERCPDCGLIQGSPGCCA